jgi:predicted GNAT superfamily acetyltransferase
MNRKQLITSGCMFLAILGGAFHVAADEKSATTAVAQRSPEQDRKALIALEKEWLENEHDPGFLARILATDFVHPVAAGVSLTKAQHIYHATTLHQPDNLKRQFGRLQVRLYGDVGIVNGIVVSSDEKGNEVGRSIFTDVFNYQGGKWQAINAQENKVEPGPRPK